VINFIIFFKIHYQSMIYAEKNDKDYVKLLNGKFINKTRIMNRMLIRVTDTELCAYFLIITDN
jgi:hypothetical protein